MRVPYFAPSSGRACACDHRRALTTRASTTHLLPNIPALCYVPPSSPSLPMIGPAKVNKTSKYCTVLRIVYTHFGRPERIGTTWSERPNNYIRPSVHTWYLHHDIIAAYTFFLCAIRHTCTDINNKNNKLLSKEGKLLAKQKSKPCCCCAIIGVIMENQEYATEYHSSCVLQRIKYVQVKRRYVFNGSYVLYVIHIKVLAE